jgi:tetratricopeptide (TPR) repeat protein
MTRTAMNTPKTSPRASGLRRRWLTAPRTIALGACATLFILSATPNASGDERSYAGALAQLHQGNAQQALEAFQLTSVATPNDPLPHYFQGLALGRLGRWKEAADAHREALKLSPGLPAAELGLGHALVELGDYDAAIPLLEGATAKVSNKGQAHLLLGIVDLRQNRFAQAKEQMDQAAELDQSLDLACRFYRGVTEYREGNHSEAAKNFKTVVRDAPDSIVGQEASEYLVRLAAHEEDRLRLFGRTGFEYDSNLTLAPSNNEIREGFKVSEDDDVRAVFEAGGTYLLGTSGNARFTAGYNFFQSLHFDFEENNIQSHRVGAQVATVGSGVTYGTSISYEHMLADTDGFLDEVKLRPWITIPQGERGVGHLYYQFAVENYDEFNDDSIDFLDARRHTIGAREVFYLGDKKRYIGIGAVGERREAYENAGEQYAYYSGRADLGISWRVFDDTQLAGSLSYEYRDYDSASEGRQDNRFIPRVGVYHRLTERLWLVAKYELTINNSNKDAEGFEYDRNVAAIGVEVR